MSEPDHHSNAPDVLPDKKVNRMDREASRPGSGFPFSLVLSFAKITGIPIKFCGMDGQPVSGANIISPTGPCAILGRENAFSDACARNHAAAASMAVDLRRPYIFNCHARLAEWAIPIPSAFEQFQGVILCGGALLSNPDSALVKHIRSVAIENNIEPAELVRSLDSVPVVSRERLRMTADFLFQLATALAAPPPPADDDPEAHTTSIPAFAEVAVVYPHARKKETKKKRLHRAAILGQENVETEIVRLLRERKPDPALEMLLELIQEMSASGEGLVVNLAVAETLTRLFRRLVSGAHASPGLCQKHSQLISEILSKKLPAESHDPARRICQKFVYIMEEVTGESRPRQVKAIQRFVEKNLTGKLTLGSVGKKFGLKEKALDALVRTHCGMGFTDYVTSIRISEAKRLLRSGDLGIGQVARRAGFRDQSYFTKVFKGLLGLTPTEFKERERERKETTDSEDR